ncbi:MAG TPA: permease-like cell division protein FtsX [Candidatus Paceibacterota bacterium]|nr:permease-like cell division protein FtsX [Candidatus Paceibacterota bacterium]
MLTTNLKRIATAGGKNFLRSGAVSFATVLIMTVTLLIVGFLVFLSALLTHTLGLVEDKVDVNVYFTVDAPESAVLAVQDDLEGLPEVASVVYTSRDQALAEFRERHGDDELTLQALDELGENPLGASLAVKAKDPTQYEGIVNYLADSPTTVVNGSDIVDRINYYQNKAVIDRLTGAIDTMEKAGALIVVLFAVASVIIALATIRLAIYTARDEIAVMRLVGASNMYIRGPFIVAGVLSGIVAAVISLIVFYPATWYAGNALATWLGGFNLFTYYLSNFAMIFGILVGSGILIGALASWLAVRRYLRV